MSGPFVITWEAKRIIQDGTFGGGDLALDDIRVSECEEGSSTVPTSDLGAFIYNRIYVILLNPCKLRHS